MLELGIWSLHFTFVTDDDTRFLRARERLKLFLENQQPRSLVGVAKLKIRFRRNKCVTACGQFKYLATQPRATFAGENVVKMFQRAGVARAAAVRVERDLRSEE